MTVAKLKTVKSKTTAKIKNLTNTKCQQGC